ncbi:MAG: CapA family protein [Lachnospiraceae bacterium]|nr:CapA family protein [Lachnospiraceae bacterium]
MKSFLRGLIRGLVFLLPILFISCGIFYVSYLKNAPGQEESSKEPLLSEAPAPVSADDISSMPVTDIPDASEAPAAPGPGEALASDKAPEEAYGPVTLTFAGDILFTEYPLSGYQARGISSLVSDELLAYMTGSDLFMLNEEFPFSTRGEAAADKQYTFRVDPSYVRIFQELGVDIATVANNHALDFGTEAFTDSLDTLDAAGIARVGGGRNLEEAKAPVIREISGYTIGILGASRVIPVSSWAAGKQHPGMFTTYDPSLLKQEIQNLKNSCDYVAVYVHWGIEKDTIPQDYQRQLACAYIDAGADMVIGSHPHVMQGFEYYHGKPIAYSLGNFLFSNSSNETVLYRITIETDGSLTPSIIPCTRRNGQMQIMASPNDFFSRLSGLSFHASVEASGDGNAYILEQP